MKRTRKRRIVIWIEDYSISYLHERFRTTSQVAQRLGRLQERAAPVEIPEVGHHRELRSLYCTDLAACCCQRSKQILGHLITPTPVR